jgi:hypothetical protein
VFVGAFEEQIVDSEGAVAVNQTANLDVFDSLDDRTSEREQCWNKLNLNTHRGRVDATTSFHCQVHKTFTQTVKFGILLEELQLVFVTEVAATPEKGKHVDSLKH